MMMFPFNIGLMIFLASVNVNGVRSVDKFEKFVALCKADICLQETHWDITKEIECKKQWSTYFFANNGVSNTCGVAVLITSKCVKELKLVYSDGARRIIHVEFMYEDVKYNLLNIYAPSQEVERKGFFQGLGNKITGNCIIVGDFNVKCTRLDVSRTTTFKGDMSRATLIEVINQKELCDVWRTQNPITREYSRVQVVLGVLKQSRIDLVLAKVSLLNHINSVNYKLTALSDHAILRFGLGDIARGRSGGLWCLNSSLLKQETYCKMIRRLVQSEVSKAKCDDDPFYLGCKSQQNRKKNTDRQV